MGFSLKNKRAVLFDMDGVLYDSMPSHVSAWVRALAEFGYNMSVLDVYLNEGCTGAQTIRSISEREGKGDVSDENIQRMYARKTELFMQLPPVNMMPGALEVMRKAAADGLQIQVVTGSGTGGLIERVQRDYEGYVVRPLMVTAFDVERGKPYPDPYLKALEIGKITAEEAVVVENAPLGIRAARAVGIETIAVNTGPIDDATLLAEGPVLIFPSVQALADNWDSLKG